jgi:glyoxylase-like metal-dependent hydrolase (beta-lactamase superfamily II)
VGSVEALKEKLGPDVQVLLGELDARILAGEKVVDSKLPGSWPKVQWAPDVRLAPGDRVGSLEVVASPGHTPGHISFLDTRDRTLIAGDTFTSYGDVAISNHFYWRFPFAAMATWDKGKDLESARALRALDPSLLVVGHGPATAAPGAAMDKAIARAGG